jgi:hypothetical protein
MLAKGSAAIAGRNEIGADVTQRGQPSILVKGGETSETAPRHILEQDSLDRIFGAEREDLMQIRDGQHALRIGSRRADPRSCRAR